MNILVCVTLLSSFTLTSARTRLILSANEERGNSESLFDEEFDNDGLLKPFKVLPPEDVEDFQGGDPQQDVKTDNVTQQMNRVADNAENLQMEDNKDASNPADVNEMPEGGKFSQLEPQEEYRRRQVAEDPEPQEEEDQISQKERSSMEPEDVVPETYSLKGIRSILSPDILHTLATCGWKDELVIVDNAYPIPVCDNTNCDKHKILRLDGAPLLLLVQEIMNLWKLDDHNPLAIMLMGDKQDVSETLKFVLSKIITEEEKCGSMDTMDRADLLTYNEFSKRVDKARFIIKTGEVGPWNNIILRKGMITGACEDHKEDEKIVPTRSNERSNERSLQYERKQMDDKMNDQMDDQINDQIDDEMNDQIDKDSRELSSGGETSENDAGINRAYASEEMDEEHFDGDFIPDKEELTGDDLQDTEPREHDSLPEKEAQQYYPEIEALKTAKDNLGEHIEKLNPSTKDRDYSSVEKAEGPYHEKLQRHHQFTDTKYKHNVTIPESLRAPDARPEEPSVQNQNNDLRVPSKGVITPPGPAPHGIPVPPEAPQIPLSPEAPHGIPLSPEAPHGIQLSPEAPHGIQLSPEAPQSNPAYSSSSSVPVTANAQKAPQSLVRPVQPTEEQAKHQGNDAFRNPEYPPGYRRAINLELNGTFSNGQDQQEGEILMNIDALRKYNSNLEKAVQENNGRQYDNQVNLQYPGGTEQTRNNPDEISAALKELTGIKDVNQSSIPGLKPN